MKTFKARQFDDKDEEIVDTLISLGMNRSVARTLTYLQNVDEATSPGERSSILPSNPTSGWDRFPSTSEKSLLHSG